jgi:CheY-like chemotaxis protein
MSTVLVVDDDPNFLASVEQLLAAAGYYVLRAADGGEAVELLDKKHREIDLTIMDLSLPGINGFEIIGAISRRPNPIKIIATTGVYKDYHLEVAKSLGAHAIIRKPPEGNPLPESEWLGTVRRLIGAANHENSASAASGRNASEDFGGSK